MAKGAQTGPQSGSSSTLFGGCLARPRTFTESLCIAGLRF